ncbi:MULTISPECIES: RNA recognition motif domain-containing protein [Chitinophagaceae]
MKLFVAGLPNDFDDVDFKEMFELYGTVLSAKIIVDHNTKKSKGFGFLDMPIDSEAQAVISTLNGVKMAGKPIVVKEATEQAQRPATGGGFRPQRSGGFNNDSRPRFNNRDGNRGYSSNRDNGGSYSGNRDNGGYSGNRDSNRNYNAPRNNNRNFNRDNQSDNRY